jgi:hypothetical protein
MARQNIIDRDAPYTAGGVSRPVGIAVVSGLGLLFLLMLGGPAGGLPIAATLAYLVLYTLAYRILRPAAAPRRGADGQAGAASHASMPARAGAFRPSGAPE